MDSNELISKIEAILFASGDPLEGDKIAESLGVTVEQVDEAVKELSSLMQDRKSGLSVVTLGNKYQMCTRAEYAQVVRLALDAKRNAPLSAAAFEVLAVIAYNQPVTKAFVEQVRGVDCYYVISTLTQKGLIEEKGRLELPGRPLLYGTTSNFLRCFSLSSLEELPALPDKDKLTQTSEDDPIDNVSSFNGKSPT